MRKAIKVGIERVIELGPRHDIMHQPLGQCLVGVVAIGRQDDIQRLRSPDGHHQITDRRQAITQAQPPCGNRESAGIRGDTNIAAKG